MGAPSSPGVSTSLVDFDGAFETGVRCAWGTSAIASGPVDMVDLPESNVKSSVGIVIHGVCVSSTFMGDDAFAAVSIPIVFSAPSADILHGFGGSAGTAGTFA